jgi:formylglycine-generating enzyme required for sulfatase activity
MAHDVFISYSAGDKPFADAACAKLESRNIRCWIAPRDIRPGMTWGTAIVEAIDRARVMLLVFSTHANASPQISREVERAVNKGLVVMPVRVEDVLPSGDLEYFLGTPHWLDAITPPFERHLDHIADVAKSWLDPSDSPKPPRPPTPAPARPKWIVPAIFSSVIALTAAFIGARYYFAQKERAPAHPTAVKTFRDCTGCPEMVVVSAGTFTMGSPSSEPGRYENESPQHLVTIGYAFAVGKYPVTRDEYGLFASETNRTFSEWLNPSFAQTGRSPVVNVGWDDAKAYVVWLSQKTGQRYRLLSEAEYEYAERAGTTTAYWWGDEWNCSYANGSGCGHNGTVQVGSYPPNAFGLYDMAGNTWEWVEDCWHENYTGAPANGAAWTTAPCDLRDERGGSWGDGTRDLRSAERDGEDANDREGSNGGFRVARTL